MARQARPWYWRARGRWASTIGKVRYTAPGSIGETDKHAAWAWHKALLEDLRPSRPHGLQVADLCNLWLDWDHARVVAGDREGRTHGIAATKLRKVCGTVVDGRKFGFTPIDQVNLSHLERLLQVWAADGMSAGYRRELAMAVKMIFTWATKPQASRERLLPASPVVGIVLPPAPVPSERFADRVEAAAWLRWLWRHDLREFALLQRCLIHTGARPSELASACWAEIRWLAQETESGHWISVLVRRRWKSARKTGRVRRVFLPARLCRSLLRRMHATGDLDSLIWTAPRGGPWSISNLSTYTARIRDLAIADGLQVQAEGPDRLVNYRWRHTAASSLLMSGVDLITVAELLGTSVKMLTHHYAHLLQGHLGQAAERLARKR